MPQLSEGGPYVYPTWLPKLLAGLDRGEWKIWFQVHHDGKTWDKLESDFDLTRYNIEHTELLRLCTEEYKGRGFTVTVERQNDSSCLLFEEGAAGNRTVSSRPHGQEPGLAGRATGPARPSSR